VIDRDRLTCSGGTAPLDLMCNLIRHKGGKGLAADVSAQFIVDRIRDQHDHQHIPLLARVGTGHESLIDAALAMEMNIENPRPLDDLAAELGVSLRHLERLFKRYLGSTPAQYYLDLRLRRARELLLQTNMSVMEVTVATGFLSSSHFSKSYRTCSVTRPAASASSCRWKPPSCSSCRASVGNCLSIAGKLHAGVMAFWPLP